MTSPVITPTEEVRRTIVEYGQLIDDRDLDAWVDLYCRDGIHEISGNRYEGRDELRAFMGAAFDRIQDLRHIMIASSIYVDGEAATATTDWMTFRRDADGQATVASVGRWDDELRLEEGRWRFAHRRASRWAGAPPAQPPKG